MMNGRLHTSRYNKANPHTAYTRPYTTLFPLRLQYAAATTC